MKQKNRDHNNARLEVANTKKAIREPTIIVNILPGKCDESHKRLFRTFWMRLLAKVQGELDAYSEVKGENE